MKQFIAIATLLCLVSVSSYGSSLENLITLRSHEHCTEIYLQTKSAGYRWEDIHANSFSGEEFSEFNQTGILKGLTWTYAGRDGQNLLNFDLRGWSENKLSESSYSVTSHKLVQSVSEDERYVAGRFFSLLKFENWSKSYKGEKGVPIEMFLFYVNTSGLIPASDRIANCTKINTLELSRMQEGHCYWLDGSTARDDQGKPYCW